jgi:glutamine synthetase
MAREWFGDAFVEHFAATREWEEREFRKHIRTGNCAVLRDHLRPR